MTQCLVDISADIVCRNDDRDFIFILLSTACKGLVLILDTPEKKYLQHAHIDDTQSMDQYHTD